MNKLLSRFQFLILSGFFLTGPIQAQQEVGFIETFALSENRAEVLKQLIPGTEDYYYFHALHYQNERQVDDLNKILTEWRKHFRNSSGRKEIENREALITYSKDPKATLEYLKKELDLKFNHQQEGKAREANHPSTLDQDAISWDAFLTQARQNTTTLQNLGNSAFYRFLKSKPKLEETELRSLLSRGNLPDLPNLTDLILRDLRSKASKGFGEFDIHRVLTKQQLDQLVKKRPELLSNEDFVFTYLGKLLPGTDDHPENSPAVREAYFDRAWAFASQLDATFNSLKANILYHRLAHDLAQENLNKDRFRTYLSIPRHVSYFNPGWRKLNPGSWNHAADLQRSFDQTIELPPIQNDQDLVKHYLLHFLKSAPTPKAFQAYLRDDWLRQIFAEAKITHGIGKPEDWAALLSPAQFQALKDRVDIEFDRASQQEFKIGDEVSLTVHLKNVPKLIVKVFEINTLNYYQNFDQEISTDINLDGLVANQVHVHEYSEAPQRRIARNFKFPGIEKRRGLWVVEFIGGGKSSRALIRKGALRVIRKTASAGDLVTILDENYQALKGSSIWIGNKQYPCNDQGQTLLPFSNDPGYRSAILQDSNGFASLAMINRPREDFHLKVRMHLEQESLRSEGQAKIFIRPTLFLAGKTISLDKIESASLDLQSKSLEGLPASISTEDFKLFSDRESIHEFRVPDGTVEITATLRVQLKVASQGAKEIELSSAKTFSTNGFLKTTKVADFYLSKIDGSYQLEYLGRNGEPIQGQNLNLTFRHRHFKNPRSVTLKTNELGSLNLGPLEDIENLSVSASKEHSRSWTLRNDRRDHASLLTLTKGQALKVPFIGDLNREHLSFHSRNSKGLLADMFSRLKLENGYLTATDLPAGDYHLFFRDTRSGVEIKVGEGTVSKGHVFNDARRLELPPRQAAHISEVDAQDNSIEISVANADPLTRIHLIATRFVPGTDAFQALGGSQRARLNSSDTRYLPSLYISGRNLGDELRYILERQYAQKFVGNMLTRPELLLNPWDLRKTETELEKLQAGDDFQRQPVPAPMVELPLIDDEAEGGRSRKPGTSPRTQSYEFLQSDPVVVANLAPDEEGKISINLDVLGDRQHVHVLLIDPDGCTYRQLSLPDRKTKFRDLRLLKGLDPKRPVTKQDRVSRLAKGESITIPNAASAEFEVFDHLASAFQYFLTLSNDATLREFSFITAWPSLSKEEKTAKYSKFACHELSFFLSQKDPAFFKEVVLPHLAHKKDRTFMDDYLLGKPLERYLSPYEFARLNVVERILLSRKDDARLAALTRDLADRLALEKTDPNLSQYWFRAALNGNALKDSKGGAGRLLHFEDDRQAAQTSGDLIDYLDGRATILRRPSAGLKARFGRKKAKATDAFAILPASSNFSHSSISLYRALKQTKEWAENNYYRLPISQHQYALITANRFWLDLAKSGAKPGFETQYLGEASRNFPEMMLALSFLDLPFTAPEHQSKVENGTLEFSAGGPLFFFHREIKEAPIAKERPPLLVAQSYFQLNDRFRMEDGRQVDKFITKEFIRGQVYGSQVVVTNPTSSEQRLNLLTQLPEGAIPLSGKAVTDSAGIQLKPYATHLAEFFFYFPKSGSYSIYPAHLSRAGEVITHADALTFQVLDKPSTIDQKSWTWISQWGDEDLVLNYLKKENLHAIELGKIAWRVRESSDFLQKVLTILKTRGFYHPTIQSYAIPHNKAPEIEQFLLMQKQFLSRCGLALESDLITLDPIEFRSYQHLEYKPLINSRAHKIGGENRILNPAIRSQYLKFLSVLSQRKELGSKDHLGVTYYLFLQDRVERALSHLSRIKEEDLDTKMQLDYLKAYAAFHQADLETARQISTNYQNYPVDRWRKKFADITTQIAEVEGADPTVREKGNREQEQQSAAALESFLKLNIEGRTAKLEFQNVEEVTVNYYEMDLEFLFSSNPFVSSGTTRFSIIQPNQSVSLTLPEGKKVTSFELPETYQASNIIVEVLGGGKKASQAVYANELTTVLSETMGLLTVRHQKTNKPVSKAYIKVYAKTQDGVEFFKDGYTDLRGKFDYASVSTKGLGDIQKFSILVLSEPHGATVLEATVPSR